MSHVTMWCVYDRPGDYPHSYVAREWLIGTDGRQRSGRSIISPTYDGIRTLIPLSCDTWIPRAQDDDPCILGCWI